MPDHAEYKSILRGRMARWRAFYEGSDPGDLMVLAWTDRTVSLEAFLCNRLFDNAVDDVLDPRNVPAMMADYVGQFRDHFDAIARHDDDLVPEALVYWGVGGINAAMAGGEPFHDGMTCWLEPELSWDQIAELRFDPDNRWVQFALNVNKALWKLWDEDFHVLPFLHRSPLDAANGVRGNGLFEEMYTNPAAVHRLIDWCVDWQLACEQFLADNDGRCCPPGWGTAVWNHWLPDRAVFVNGDPVGLISREMALEFEQPYTARLFASAGGGFYHNHTIGLYQAGMVAKTPGTLVQFFVDDPRQPTGAEALLDMPEMREKLVAASLDSPIGLWACRERLDEMLAIMRHGRFVLAMGFGEDTPRQEIDELIAKARRSSNLD